MKKIILVCIIAVITVFCTSCSENIKIPSVNTAVEENAVVTVGEKEYKCHISYVNDVTSSVAFSSPESLKNMTFRKNSDGFSVSLGTLICKSESFDFSESCVFVQIMNALSAVKQENVKFMSKQNDKYMFSLKDNPVCKFFTDADGNITSFSGKNIKIAFDG